MIEVGRRVTLRISLQVQAGSLPSLPQRSHNHVLESLLDIEWKESYASEFMHEADKSTEISVLSAYKSEELH